MRYLNDAFIDRRTRGILRCVINGPKTGRGKLKDFGQIMGGRSLCKHNDVIMLSLKLCLHSLGEGTW